MECWTFESETQEERGIRSQDLEYICVERIVKVLEIMDLSSKIEGDIVKGKGSERSEENRILLGKQEENQ